MSVKNFKITTGLDIDGLVLNVGAGNALYWNGDAIATQQYVTDALVGVDFDLSNNAGYWLDWNANTSQFDVNIPAGTYATPADIPSLSGYATESFVTGQGYITSSGQYIQSTENILSVTAGQLSINTGVTLQKRQIGPTSYGLEIDTSGVAGSGLTATDFSTRLAIDTDIVATHDYVTGLGYITSSALSDYTPTASLNTDVVAEYPGATNLYFTNNRAVTAISNELVQGGGINYVANTGFQVDTSIIATKAYADSIAQGLDIKQSVVAAFTENVVLADGAPPTPGARYLFIGQTDPSENGIYVVSGTGTWARPSDAIVGTTLTKGAFVFVEGGTYAGHGYVATEVGQQQITFTQFSETGSYITSVAAPLSVTNSELAINYGGMLYNNGSNHLDVNTNAIVGTGLYVNHDLGDKILANTNAIAYAIVGTGLKPDYSNGTVAVNANAIIGGGLYINHDLGDKIVVNANALIGTGLYINHDAGDKIYANTNAIAYAIYGSGLAPDYATGTIKVDTTTIATKESPTFTGTVKIENSTNAVASDHLVFGNGNTEAYNRGSGVTVGTLPTGTEVADVFITLKITAGLLTDSRTSKLTFVNTGGDAPTWTEYGIINSANFPATTISFDSSGNIIANVTGSGTYSVKGVVTTLK